MTRAILLLMAMVFASLSTGSAMTCEKEVLFFKTQIHCPLPGQPENFIFCCGDDDDVHCCPSPFGEIDQETVDEIVKSLPKILGILFGTVVFIIALCIICCCCCPFCLCYKRRAAGTVQRGTTEVTVTVPPTQHNPNQQPGQQVPMYATQGQPLIQPQQQYAPQPGYPPMPQAGYPGQPQPGYPAAAPGAPAPGYPDQPPPYTEKQPAFNPNYAA